MKSILIAIIFSFALFRATAEGGRLTVCVPLLHENIEVSDKVSFDETLKNLNEIPDKLFLNTTFPVHIGDNEIVTAKGYLQNFTLSNFLNFSYCLFPVYNEPLNVTLNTVKIHVDEYNLTGVAGGLFEYFGQGPLDIEMGRFSFAVNNLFPSFFHPGCVTVDLSIALQKFKVNFKNLMNDKELEKLLNDVIGDMGSDVIDYVWAPLYDFMIPYIQQFLDKYVNKSELKNFIATYLREGNTLKQAGVCTNYPPTP